MKSRDFIECIETMLESHRLKIIKDKTRAYQLVNHNKPMDLRSVRKVRNVRLFVESEDSSTNFTKMESEETKNESYVQAEEVSDSLYEQTNVTNFTNTTNNSHEEIKIPFNPWSRERLSKGIKTATSRNERYGNPGDRFKVGSDTYVLTAITKKSLKEVAEQHYKEEGAESPEEYIGVWEDLHPGRGYVPGQIVFYHEFRKSTGNGNSNGNGSKPHDTIDQRTTVDHVRMELGMQARHFPNGINEHLIIRHGTDWGIKEDSVKDTIDQLIERGDINILRTDEQGIRYIKWVR